MVISKKLKCLFAIHDYYEEIEIVYPPEYTFLTVYITKRICIHCLKQNIQKSIRDLEICGSGFEMKIRTDWFWRSEKWLT